MELVLKIKRPNVIIAKVQGKLQQYHGTHTTPIKVVHDDKYGKSIGSCWVGTFGWKLRSRSRAPSTSQLAEKTNVALP
jgi:hypothetical protein